MGSDAAAVLVDDWEETTLPIRQRPVRRHPSARGTAPPQGQEEPASAEVVAAVRDALVDAGCTILDAVMRVVRWEIDELEAFARDTGVSPGELFQPGVVRSALDIAEGAGRLAGCALDAVGAAVSDRLVAAGARAIRPMARAFAGTDPIVERSLSELATASRRAHAGVSKHEAAEFLLWAADERRHAAGLRPVAGKLTSALLALWVVKSCEGPSRPRAGVDEASWRAACLRLFGVAEVPPRMMARLQLEALWFDMGLTVSGPIDWPTGGTGAGSATFNYAANPRALAARIEGHAPGGERFRHLAAGGRFRLRFRFSVREPSNDAGGLADIDYELDLLPAPHERVAME